MIESRRRAYLEALGFDVWSLRPPAPDFDRLLIESGEGGTLLLCNLPGDRDSPVAGDIARALGGAVVWAWPDPDGGAERPSLEDAIGQRLFTRVVLFGAGLSRQIFEGEVPLVVGSARILTAPGIGDIAANGSARREFWNQLSGSPAALI